MTHFGHTNIIKHRERPFANADEMDAVLIRNINELVAESDTLYHLGDFAFRGAHPAVYRAQIVCRNIIVINGNHDPHHKDGTAKGWFREIFSHVDKRLNIRVYRHRAKQKIVLDHYPIGSWDGVRRGSWHLYGHCHGTYEGDLGRKCMDIGVDCWDFKPLNLDQIGAIMDQRILRPVDHHKAEDDDCDKTNTTPSHDNA